jgi:hypothetical protein
VTRPYLEETAARLVPTGQVLPLLHPQPALNVAAAQTPGNPPFQAQNGRGAGVWTDQTSVRLPAISLAWSGEGARGVGRDLSHAQHSEVTPALLWIEKSKKGPS